MSKKKKKARRRAPSGYDSHHLLWTRRTWDRGSKLLLRRSFIYEIPIVVHQELHSVIEPIPPLSEDEARWLYDLYSQEKRNMELFEALEWLQLHAPNSEFAMAIMAQSRFLQNHLGRS